MIIRGELSIIQVIYSKSPLFSDQVFRGEPERSVYEYMTEGETDERRWYGNKEDLLYVKNDCLLICGNIYSLFFLICSRGGMVDATDLKSVLANGTGFNRA